MIRKELFGLVESQEPGIQVKESVCTRKIIFLVSELNSLYETRIGGN